MVSTRYNLYVHPGIHPWATGKWHGSTHFWLEHPGLWGKVKGSTLKLSYSLEKPTQTLMSNVHSNHNLQTVLCILSIPFSNWDATPPLTPLSAFRHASLTRYVLQYKIKYASASVKLKCYIRSWNCREQSPVGGFITIQIYFFLYISNFRQRGWCNFLSSLFFFTYELQRFLVEKSFWQCLAMHEKHTRVCVNSAPIWDGEKETTSRELMTEISDATPRVRKPQQHLGATK